MEVRIIIVQAAINKYKQDRLMGNESAKVQKQCQAARYRGNKVDERGIGGKGGA